MKRKIFTRTNGLAVAKFLKSTVLKATLCLIVLLGLSAINANAADEPWRTKTFYAAGDWLGGLGGDFSSTNNNDAYKLNINTSTGIGTATVSVTQAGEHSFQLTTSDWGTNYKWDAATSKLVLEGTDGYNNLTAIPTGNLVTGNYLLTVNFNALTFTLNLVNATPPSGPWSTNTFYAAGDWLGALGSDYGPTNNNNAYKLNVNTTTGIGTVVLNNVTAGAHSFQLTTADWGTNYKWDAATSKIILDGSGGKWGVPIPTGNLTGGTYTLTVDFGTLTYTLVPGNTLPVTWVSFKGKATNNGVLLNWQTAEEKNNQYFEVERSTDGINFTALAKVYPNSTHSYTYTDKQAQAKNIYRIKQVDNDGKVDYSDLVAVNVNLQNNSIIQYITNPSSNLLKVGLSKNLNLPAKLSVYGTNGTILKTVSVNDTDNNVIDISALANGVYVFGVEANGQAERKLFVKQ